MEVFSHFLPTETSYIVLGLFVPQQFCGMPWGVLFCFVSFCWLWHFLDYFSSSVEVWDCIFKMHVFEDFPDFLWVKQCLEGNIFYRNFSFWRERHPQNIWLITLLLSASSLHSNLKLEDVGWSDDCPLAFVACLVNRLAIGQSLALVEKTDFFQSICFLVRIVQFWKYCHWLITREIRKVRTPELWTIPI